MVMVEEGFVRRCKTAGEGFSADSERLTPCTKLPINFFSSFEGGRLLTAN